MSSKQKCGNLLVVIAVSMAMGCLAYAQGASEKEAAEAREKAAEAMAQMTEGGADPIDYRQYRDLMPDALLGLKRGECSGQNQKAQGMSSSTVTCEYGESDARIRVKFHDMGTMGQAAMMMRPAFGMDFEVENDEGFQKSTTVDDFPGRHSWDEPAKASELALMLGDRGLMEIKAYEMESSGAVRAAKALPLKRFASLASHK